MKSYVRRILITGGGGFIGFHLATALTADSANEITLVDNFARGKMDRELAALCARPGVRMLSLDLCDAASYAQVGDRYDEVYHLAAMLGVENVLQRPVDVLRVNALMTAQFLEWFIAGGGEKLLFSSTSEAYAWTLQFHELPIPTPEDVPLALTDLKNPRSTYAGSKIFGEMAVIHYCRSVGKPFAIARYHNVYGPRMGNDHVIPQLYRRAADGQNPLVVYSAGGDCEAVGADGFPVVKVNRHSNLGRLVIGVQHAGAVVARHVRGWPCRGGRYPAVADCRHARSDHRCPAASDPAITARL